MKSKFVAAVIVLLLVWNSGLTAVAVWQYRAIQDQTMETGQIRVTQALSGVGRMQDEYEVSRLTLRERRVEKVLGAIIAALTEPDTKEKGSPSGYTTSRNGNGNGK